MAASDSSSPEHASAGFSNFILAGAIGGNYCEASRSPTLYIEHL